MSSLCATTTSTRVPVFPAEIMGCTNRSSIHLLQILLPEYFQVLTGTEMLAKRFLKHAQSEIYLAYKFNSLLYA